MDFYQGCVLIAVVAFVILVVVAIKTLIQIAHTAEAVEYLAVSTAEKVEKTRSTFELLDNVSSLLDSGFYKAVKTGVDFVHRLRGGK